MQSVNVYLGFLFDEIAVCGKNILQTEQFSLLMWVTLTESACEPGDIQSKH